MSDRNVPSGRPFVFALVWCPVLSLWPGCIAGLDTHDVGTFGAETRGAASGDETGDLDAAMPVPSHSPGSVAERPDTPATPVPVRTLTDLFILADRYNPEIRAARMGIAQARALASQAGAWPNPSLDLAAEDLPLHGWPGRGKTTIGIVQPVVLGRRLTASASAANARTREQAASAELARRDVLVRIERTYVELLVAREAVRVIDHWLSRLRRTHAIADARVAEGTSPRVEALRVDADVRRLKTLREQHAAAEDAARIRLAALAGVPIDLSALSDQLPEPEPFEASPEQRWVAEHPAWRAADAAVAAAGADLLRLRSERVPDVAIRVAAGQADGESIVEFGAGMTVPLWDQARGARAAARWALASARLHAAAVHRDLILQFEAVTREYAAALQRARTLGAEVHPQARLAAELLETSWQGGRASLLDMLSAQREAVEAELDALQARAEALQARARLRALLGYPPAIGQAAESRADHHPSAAVVPGEPHAAAHPSHPSFRDSLHTPVRRSYP